MAKKRSKSFRRSYREDYVHEIEAPGIIAHIGKTFGIIFKNYKIFLPFFIIVLICGVLTIGADGLVGQTSSGVFAILILLMIWMVVIFILRQLTAGHKIKLRDAMYNAFTALIPTVIVLATVVISCLPIAMLIIAYSAAVETEFLAMPFYALLFCAFALLMVLLVGYMLTSTIVALVAVTAPGLYPIVAVMAAADLVVGRRMKIIVRLIVLAILVALSWGATVVPLEVIGVPKEVLAVVRLAVAGFDGIFATTYLFLYYQWIIK